ncbi:hypothetical protein [Isorropodon fossajaponicum symbiont]|uniref:hypothetical protein n=1 Tax=Isorropodon fossajaponicum symbiont TaxID=883811 RepID=UPI0019160A92|nr:hypothetical protein [Isorropodon fossajaponicum symbiont]
MLFFSDGEELIACQGNNYYKALTLSLCQFSVFADIISGDELEEKIANAEGYYRLSEMGCKVVYFEGLFKPERDDFEISILDT